MGCSYTVEGFAAEDTAGIAVDTAVEGTVVVEMATAAGTAEVPV